MVDYVILLNSSVLVSPFACDCCFVLLGRSTNGRHVAEREARSEFVYSGEEYRTTAVDTTFGWGTLKRTAEAVK